MVPYRGFLSDAMEMSRFDLFNHMQIPADIMKRRRINSPFQIHDRFQHEHPIKKEDPMEHMGQSSPAYPDCPDVPCLHIFLLSLSRKNSI
jgi:hypothetical protein